MLKFNIVSGRVTVDPKSLMIKELRDIYEADNDPLKWISTDILSYIHIVSQIDPDAPFFGARLDEVEVLAANNIWGSDWKRNSANLSEFHPVIEAYVDAFDKAEVRIIRSYGRKIDQLQDMIDDVDPKIEKSTNLKSGTFTYVSNTNPLMKVMKEIRIIANEKKKLEDALRQGAESDTKRWGGRSESYLEKKKKEDIERRSRRINEKERHQIEKEQKQGVSQAIGKSSEKPKIKTEEATGSRSLIESDF